MNNKNINTMDKKDDIFYHYSEKIYNERSNDGKSGPKRKSAD
jgi:hypothetical protein